MKNSNFLPPCSKGIQLLAWLLAGLCPMIAFGKGPAPSPGSPGSTTPATEDCSLYADLQSCHDALPSTGGLMVVPARTYTITSGVKITKPSVRIVGAGAGLTVLKRDPSYQTGDLMTAFGSGFYITGVTFDGNQVPNSAEEIFVIAPHSTVDRIEIVRHANIGIACAAADVMISNSQVTGLASATVGSMGIWFDSAAINRLEIVGNDIRDNRLNGVFGSGQNILISGNHFSGNHRQVYPTGGGQVAIKGVGTNARIQIVGNTIELGGGAATSGAELEGPNVVFAGNSVSGNALSGVVLQAGTTIQILANRIFDNGTASMPGPGILVDTGLNNFWIGGNSAWDDQTTKTQDWGVMVQYGASNYVISGNDLRGNLYGALLNSGTGQAYMNLP
jgi:hypothetical protein